jgi:hypothetical protein
VKRLVPLALALAGMGLVAAVCIRHGPELATAFARIDAEIFALATGLHFTVVVIRTEAWRLTLAAIGRRPPARVAHWASGLGFLAGTLEGHAALPARMAVARRLAPDATPGLREMLLSDIPVYALELCFVAALLPLAASRIDGLGWWPVVLVGAAPLAALAGLRILQQRLGRQPLAAGLAVLAAPAMRAQLAGLAALLVVLTFARIWLLITAVRLPHSVSDAAVAYIAVTLAGQLPLGPASGPAGMVAAAGHSGVGPAAAAGLAIGATSVAAVLAYAGIAGGLLARSRRSSRELFTQGGAATPQLGGDQRQRHGHGGG